MTLIIYTEDKIYYYSKEKDSDIEEIADKADISAVTVKILIYRAVDYISVISISVKDSSVFFFSSLSTLLNNDAFHFS